MLADCIVHCEEANRGTCVESVINSSFYHGDTCLCDNAWTRDTTNVWIESARCPLSVLFARVFFCVCSAGSGTLFLLSIWLLYQFWRNHRSIAIPLRLCIASLAHLGYDVIRLFSLQTSLVTSLLYLAFNVALLELLRAFALQTAASVVEILRKYPKKHEALLSNYAMVVFWSTSSMLLSMFVQVGARMFGHWRFAAGDIDGFNAGSMFALLGLSLGLLGFFPAIFLFSRKLHQLLNPDTNVSGQSLTTASLASLSFKLDGLLSCLQLVRNVVTFLGSVSILVNFAGLVLYVLGHDAAAYIWIVFWVAQGGTVFGLAALWRFQSKLIRAAVVPDPTHGSTALAFEGTTTISKRQDSFQALGPVVVSHSTSSSLKLFSDQVSHSQAPDLT